MGNILHFLSLSDGLNSIRMNLALNITRKLICHLTKKAKYLTIVGYILGKKFEIFDSS